MKKSVFILILLMGILSCQKKEEQPQVAILEDEIANTIGGSFILTNLEGFKKTINVKDDGKFADTLELEEGAYYATYEKSGMQLYLDKNSKVKFPADANNCNTYKQTVKGNIQKNLLNELDI